MKNGYLVLAAFLFFASNLIGQTIGIHSGVLFSAFEDASFDESATAVPVGVYIGTAASDNIEVGLEANLLVVPFSYDIQGLDATVNISQTVIGAYTRIFFPAATFTPYIRA